MRYLEIPPPLNLANYLESIWFLEGDATPQTPAREKILPDGRMELIFNLADPFKRFHPRHEIEIQPAILIAGQMRSYAQIEPAGRVRLLGVRFRPGGAFPIFHLPLHELTDRIIDGVALLGRWANELREKLLCSPGLPTRFELCTQALSQRLQGRAKTDPLIEEAVRRILKTEGRVRVESLFADLGLGSRQIERKFQTMVGISPKLLARIVRFQNVFKIAGQAANRWSAAALDCGYYDQAHLIHDFQKFAGQSPSSFLLEQSEISSYFLRR